MSEGNEPPPEAPRGGQGGSGARGRPAGLHQPSAGDGQPSPPHGRSAPAPGLGRIEHGRVADGDVRDGVFLAQAQSHRITVKSPDGQLVTGARRNAHEAGVATAPSPKSPEFYTPVSTPSGATGNHTPRLARGVARAFANASPMVGGRRHQATGGFQSPLARGHVRSRSPTDDEVGGPGKRRAPAEPQPSPDLAMEMDESERHKSSNESNSARGVYDRETCSQSPEPRRVTRSRSKSDRASHDLAATVMQQIWRRMRARVSLRAELELRIARRARRDKFGRTGRLQPYRSVTSHIFCERVSKE